ncbi:MAG: ABC transporter substrate-binding protein [Anaerolineae bacterium]|nr:ABC transporter substrate-binding protein [Anaerolineae bacterium]
MKKWFGWLVILSMLAATIAACGPSPEAGDKVLKVGVVAPITGPNSVVGEEFKNAVTMAFDTIDWKIGDYTVEVVWVDEETDPEKATRAYESAIVRDQITCGLLNWDASVAVALMEVSAQHKVPHFFAMGTAEVVDEKYFSDEKYTYWMAKGWPLPSKLTIGYINALDEAMSQGLWAPAEKKVALYGTDDDWARGFATAIGAQLKDAGWEVVSEDYVQIGETDFYPLLNKLKGLDVPLIAGTMSDAAAFSAMIKQSREVGLKSMIIGDGLGWIGEWYSLTGDASDGVIDQIPGWTSPEAIKFRDDFQARWDFEPSPSAAGLAYDEARFFIQIAQHTYDKTGELTRESLYQVGREDLATGKLSFTDGILMKEYKLTAESMPDFVVGSDYFVFPVIQYFGGKGSVIYPAEAKEADFRIPDSIQ